MPITKPLARFSNFMLKRLEKLSRKNDSDRDDKHIDALISIVSRGAFLDKDEKHLIERVLRFAQMEVRNIMTPRTGLVSVDKHASVTEAISLMQGNRFSKIPVFSETDDNIVGVIYLKDVIKFILHPELTGKKTVKDFTNQMYYVPETKKLSEMLEDFQSKKIRIATVVDEYGSAIGIVTIADVLGEIVGEFVDESFDINKKVVRVTAKKYIVLGDIDIEDFNHFFGTEFSSEEYESLAGFVIEQAGDIPPAGYVLEVGKHRITVRSRTANHIDKLLVEKK
jgi:putative hemolysin